MCPSNVKAGSTFDFRGAPFAARADTCSSRSHKCTSEVSDQVATIPGRWGIERTRLTPPQCGMLM